VVVNGKVTDGSTHKYKYTPRVRTAEPVLRTVTVSENGWFGSGDAGDNWIDSSNRSGSGGDASATATRGHAMVIAPNIRHIHPSPVKHQGCVFFMTAILMTKQTRVMHDLGIYSTISGVLNHSGYMCRHIRHAQGRVVMTTFPAESKEPSKFGSKGGGEPPLDVVI